MINITISTKDGEVLTQAEIQADIKKPGATDIQLSDEVIEYLGFRFEVEDIN